MIEFLFLDLDDTILDFHRAERQAIANTLRDFGVEPTEETAQRYHLINKWHWEQLELGRFTREEMLANRFRVLFQELGREVDPYVCAQVYGKHLSAGAFFLPGAREAVQCLHQKYRLFLASNGTASVQHGRLTRAGLYPYFEAVFISEEIGHNKPSREFFDGCFAKIPGFDPQKAMIVGDSLTSDIQGGINAGITTVWVNPNDTDCPSTHPDYQIEALHQLEDLLAQEGLCE